MAQITIASQRPGGGGQNIPSTGWVDRNIPLTGWGGQNISTKNAASASATKIGPMKCDIMDHQLAGQSTMLGCLQTCCHGRPIIDVSWVTLALPPPASVRRRFRL